MASDKELRPAARSPPGPTERWEQLDRAEAELGTALEGVVVSAIAPTFDALSDIARTLATRIEHLNPQRAPAEVAPALISQDEQM